MNCPECNATVPRGWIRCPQCDQAIKQSKDEESPQFCFCAKCGERVPVQLAVCPKCGSMILKDQNTNASIDISALPVPPSIKKRNIIIAALVILSVLIMVGSCMSAFNDLPDLGQPAGQYPKQNWKVGDKVIFAEDFVLAKTREDFSDLKRYAKQERTSELEKMLKAGQLIKIHPGTEITILSISNDIIKVEASDGPNTGVKGYLPIRVLDKQAELQGK